MLIFFIYAHAQSMLYKIEADIFFARILTHRKIPTHHDSWICCERSQKELNRIDRIDVNGIR